MSGLGLKLGNAIGYQAVWFCCVAGAGHELPWLGPVVSLVFVLAILLWGGHARDDLRLLVFAITIGLILDSGFAASGWLRYNAAWPSNNIAPLWILALWAAFAMTLNHSLAFLRGHALLTATLGFFGGPLAYWSAAHAFGAVDFGAPGLTVIAALAIGWAVALPTIFWLDQHLRRMPARGHFA